MLTALRACYILYKPCTFAPFSLLKGLLFKTSQQGTEITKCWKAQSIEIEAFPLLRLGQSLPTNMSQRQVAAIIPATGRARNLRACHVCNLVQTSQDFRRNGCPNCEQYLEVGPGDIKVKQRLG